MESRYGEILSQVFCDVIMRYAFMFGDVAPKDELPVDGGHYLCAKVDFSGYRSGTLGISTTVDLCIQLAVNVLGMELDSNDSEDYAPDTLRELVNIMCGRFLTETGHT